MPIRPENRNRYGPDWPEFSRSIRFDRAGGRCECHGECGRGTHHGRCPNEHDAPAYGTGSKVVLTVAHLCHTPECREHVKAMCQGCHLHYDRDHHRETRERTRRDAAAAAGQTALALSPGGHMTTIHDLARIAATMRLAGELLDAHGHEAWRTTLEWQTGAKTASYNPDPTGQQSANCSTPPCPDCGERFAPMLGETCDCDEADE